MNSITGLGKYLFALPILAFGVMHFIGAKDMVSMVPIPGGIIWVYLTGAALILAALAMLTGKKDGLAAFLLGILLLAFILTHVSIMGNDQLPEMVTGMQPGSILKNIALAGAAFMYAHALAKDKMGQAD